MMTPAEAVDLSRKAAITVTYLNFDARMEFVETVRKATSLKDIPSRYHRWMDDPASIPEGSRAVRPQTIKGR